MQPRRLPGRRRPRAARVDAPAGAAPPARAGRRAAPRRRHADARDAAPRPPRRAPRLVPANIDAASWPRIVEGANLSGMVRQFALNCVPASFERDVLTLRLDEAVDARRSRAIEDKLLQALTKYLGARCG